MSQHLETLEQAARDFAHARAKWDGDLSEADQQVYNSMLAGIAALKQNRGPLMTQAGCNGMTSTFNPKTASTYGGGKPGTRLVDERGRVVRGLTSGESFEAAIRENASQFAVRDNEAQFCDDGLSLGGYLRSLVTGPRSSAEFAALGGSSGTAGGYNVPSILAARVIDRFRPALVVGRAGAEFIPLTSDEHSFCKLTADATASWRVENAEISESEQTFGGITFHPKSLAVIVRASRELLEDSLGIDDAIERSLIEAFASEVDRAALLGEGATEPMGLTNESGINTLTGIGAISSYADVLDAYKLMMDDNTPEPTALIISNREWRTLAGLADTTNQPLNLPPAIADLPILATSTIPTDLGAGSNESVAFLGHFPDFVVGMRSEIQVDVLKERYAEYHQYAFVAHLRMDTGVFHPESFVKLSGITA